MYKRQGLNYRISEFTAALGCIQTDRLDEIVAWKNKYAKEHLDSKHENRLRLPDGMISGYYGGAIDEILMRLMDIWYGIPFLMLAMMLVVALGPGIDTMLIIMALASFAGFVRVVRAEVLSLKQMDYVALARLSGASTVRIMFKHILPGTFSTVLVVATLQKVGLILAEAFLSYIGAGIPPPYPAWGVMIADGRNYLHSTWWVAIIPGVAILMTVMALNFLGDWMRDRLDPRLRQIAYLIGSMPWQML